MRRAREPRLGWEVLGLGGVRIGTVLAQRTEPAGVSPAWLLVRSTGLRRRLRAIPAGQAQWLPPGRLSVPYPAELVMASPAASNEHDLQDDDWREQVTRFYCEIMNGQRAGCHDGTKSA